MKMSLERTTENVETMAAAAEPEAGILLVAPSINLDGLSEKYLQAKKREGKNRKILTEGKMQKGA